MIVSGGRSQTIRFWDLESGKEAYPPLTGPIGEVYTLAVAERQGRTVIVSGSSDKIIRVWDLESGQETCPPFTRHSAPVDFVNEPGEILLAFKAYYDTAHLEDVTAPLG